MARLLCASRRKYHSTPTAFSGADVYNEFRSTTVGQPYPWYWLAAGFCFEVDKSYKAYESAVVEGNRQ